MRTVLILLIVSLSVFAVLTSSVSAQTYTGCNDPTLNYSGQGYSQCIEVDDCGDLNQANTYYLLNQSVRSDTDCFTVKGDNTTFDLNQYTVTFSDSVPVIIPNFGFEDGETGWNLTGAPKASVVSTGNFPAAKGYWHQEEIQNQVLKFTAPIEYQEVISDTLDLEPGRPYTISFMIHSDRYSVAAETMLTLDTPITEISHDPYRASRGCYTFSGANGPLGGSAFYSGDFMRVWGAAGGNRYFIDDDNRCVFTVTEANPKLKVIFRGLGSLPINSTLGASSGLEIWDETDEGMPYVDQVKYGWENINIYANYSDLSTGLLITGAQDICQISNSTDWKNMTYNLTKNLYEFDKNSWWFPNNEYIIRCNEVGYDNLELMSNFVLIGDIYIDAIEIKPAYNYGVRVREKYWNPRIDNVKVTNGNIVQGQSGAYYVKGIGVASSNHEVSNLNITVYGPDAFGIGGGGANIRIHDNIVNHNSKRTHNSHDATARSVAIFLGGCDDCLIYNNIIPRSNNGIVLSRDVNNAKVYNNTINVVGGGIHSYAFNTHSHTGIPVINVSFHDNFINTTRGSGVFIESQTINLEFFNNYVEIRDGPQEERDWVGKAFWSRSATGNLTIYNNTFIGYGGVDFPRAGENTSVAVVRIGANDDSRGPIRFYDNYVEAISVSELPTLAETGVYNQIFATALDLNTDHGNAPGITKYIENNTIKSNHRIITIGNMYGHSSKSYLTSNTIIKGDNPVLEFKTLFLGWAAEKDISVTDTYLLDTTVLNGASMRDYFIVDSGKKNTTILWYLDVEVLDSGSPVPDGTVVSIEDYLGSFIYPTTTSGNIPRQELKEFHIGRPGGVITITDYSPYNVSVTYSGETQNRTVYLNQSETVTFQFGAAACPDANSDGTINIIDLALVIFWQGKNSLQGDWNSFSHLDVNNDTMIDFGDVSSVISQMGQSC